MGGKLKKIAMYWQNSFMGIFVLKPLVVRKLGLFSGMENDALMHREGLKGNHSSSKSAAVIETTTVATTLLLPQCRKMYTYMTSSWI